MGRGRRETWETMAPLFDSSSWVTGLTIWKRENITDNLKTGQKHPSEQPSGCRGPSAKKSRLPAEPVPRS